MKIGKIIKRIRKAEGKTRKEVVSGLGITEAYLCAIENGKRQPEIPKNEDGILNIKESVYYKILIKGLYRTPEKALDLILDWKLDELGVEDKHLKEPLKDFINGNLSPESKKAILATYFGVRFQENGSDIDKIKKYINDITDVYRKVNISSKEPLFAKKAKKVIQQSKDELQKLAEGTFETHPENYYDAMDIIRYAKDYIHCTSYVDNKTWWESDTGRKYFDVNKEAILRGVEITRIFILKKNKLKACKEIISAQQNAGIDVYMAFVDDLPDNLLEDFLLQDGKILFKNDITPEGKIRRNVVSISDEDIRWAKRTFSALKQYAKKTTKSL